MSFFINDISLTLIMCLLEFHDCPHCRHTLVDADAIRTQHVDDLLIHHDQCDYISILVFMTSHCQNIRIVKFE